MSGKNEEYEVSAHHRIRHSTAHVMAEAVLEKFPPGVSPSVPRLRTAFTTF